jgi:hypothetical protein
MVPGKSTIVNLLKRGLERYSRTPEGALYAIKGCPMHEEPLHLVPRELREEFQREYGVYIEGELCPLCRLRLETEFGGRIERVPVQRIFLSEEKRVGVGTFTPSDPKSQDIAELTGSVDFSTIMEYGAESDPRAYRFDGELNVANRGIMEFQRTLRAVQRFGAGHGVGVPAPCQEGFGPPGGGSSVLTGKGIGGPGWMKKVGRRRSAGAAPVEEYWDGFAELSRALCRGLPEPRGVWRFRTYEEEKEWEDRMLLGESPPAGRPRRKT